MDLVNGPDQRRGGRTPRHRGVQPSPPAGSPAPGTSPAAPLGPSTGRLLPRGVATAPSTVLLGVNRRGATRGKDAP